MTTTDPLPPAAAPTAPATPALPILAEGEYDKYMLRRPVEILTVLRGLQEHKSQITLFFNAGQDLLLTMLVAIVGDQLIFDVGPDAEVNRKAAAAEKHYCVALLDKVRIQFLLRDFKPVQHEGRPAFRCAFPQELLRLQRREYYRLTTPLARPLKCRMPLPAAHGKTDAYEATLFDISGGGIGISAPPEDLRFETGQRVEGCRIELPEVGVVTCGLRVRSVFEITLKSGARVKRAGCEFFNLSGPMATLIQRYIIKVERERKARDSGIGL